MEEGPTGPSFFRFRVEHRMDHPDPCYCGVAHCGCCGRKFTPKKYPPYCNPSLLDERWVCKKCAEVLSEDARW